MHSHWVNDDREEIDQMPSRYIFEIYVFLPLYRLQPLHRSYSCSCGAMSLGLNTSVWTKA